MKLEIQAAPQDKKAVFRVTTIMEPLSVEPSLGKGANLEIKANIQRTKALRYEAILDYLKTTNYAL